MQNAPPCGGASVEEAGWSPVVKNSGCHRFSGWIAVVLVTCPAAKIGGGKETFAVVR